MEQNNLTLKLSEALSALENLLVPITRDVKSEESVTQSGLTSDNSLMASSIEGSNQRLRAIIERIIDATANLDL